jgi:nucleotide-binding universal stress UspA family protein
MTALTEPRRIVVGYDGDDHDAGIVVMGSHGRTGIGLVLMGSVAAAAARHAERPVTVHPPSDERAGAD